MGTLTYTYDANGNRTLLQDGVGGTTSYTYTTLDQISYLLNPFHEYSTHSHASEDSVWWKTMSKITSSQKTQITKDWLSEFPGMGKYKPMWLMRRVGPIVQGIILDRFFFESDYRPTFHIHNLSREDSSISLTAMQRLYYKGMAGEMGVKVEKHDQLWREAARLRREQAPVPLDGDLVLEDILALYDHMNGGAHMEYEYVDRIMISLWCARLDLASQYLEEAIEGISNWDQIMWFKYPDLVLEEWVRDKKRYFEDPSLVRAQVAASVEQFKLQKLPYSELLCG